MPTTMIIPKSEITLIVIPSHKAKANIPANETGMEMATQNDNRQLRKSAKKRMTRKNP